MNKRFVKGMILYALIFLLLAGAGMMLLWNFMDAYEQSRPVNAVKNYMESLTVEIIRDGSRDFLSKLDTNLQSEEEAFKVISDRISDEFTYVKKGKESTSDRHVYLLRDGKQPVGEIAISPTEPGKFGFSVWSVVEQVYDFSYMVSEPVSLVVPTGFTVKANGTTLSDGYITEKEIPYDALEAFYGDMPLPTMVRYQFDSVLGEVEVEIFNKSGELMEISEDTDYSVLLDACDSAQTDKLGVFVDGFIEAYVAFTGSANHQASRNFSKLSTYLISGSDLYRRLGTAIDGLQFAQSNGDKIQQIYINQISDVGNERFYCDVTYTVETWGKAGAVETNNNLKLIILNTEDGLKIEAMTRY